VPFTEWHVRVVVNDANIAWMRASCRLPGLGPAAPPQLRRSLDAGADGGC
jgi:hypothetical protein